MIIDAIRNILRELSLNPASLTAAAHDLSIFTVGIRGGDRAIDVWQRFREAVDRTQAWPIICGDASEVDDLFIVPPELCAAPADLLERAAAIDPPTWLEKAAAEKREDQAEVLKEASQFLPSFALGGDLLAMADAEVNAEADWPETPPNQTFHLHSVLSVGNQKPLKSCTLALLPTAQPTDAPGYLRFGGWNDCPPPEVHVAMLRYWAERYGAVPAAITKDVIECHVASPPRTPDEARELAREQFNYCPDVVVQGTQSIDRLAVELWQSPRWFFWWD